MKVSDIANSTLTVALFSYVMRVASFSVNRDKPLDSKGCRNRHDYRYYYDHGTESCEQCREICVHAKIMGTQEQCQNECPKYLTAMECKDREDQFYDEVLDVCTHCSTLCDNHQVKSSTRQCKDKCSAYMDKLTPKEVPSRHRQNYLQAVDGSDGESGGLQLDLHPGWIAAIVVGGVAILCFIAVVLILFRTCSSPYAPAPQRDGEEKNTDPQHPRPIEETSQGSSSMHFAIDAGGAVPTAFSDLRDDGSRGESQRV